MASEEDSQWSPADDELLMSESFAFELESRTDIHPAKVATMFVVALLDDDLDAAGALLTPENPWGDMELVAANFRDANEYHRYGISNTVVPAVGAVDVVYAKLIHGVTNTLRPEGPTAVPVDILTLVWRPDLGGWRVHQFGEYALPEDVTRTSPGRCPDY